MSANDPQRKSRGSICCDAQDGHARINDVVSCCPRREARAVEVMASVILLRRS